MALQTEKPSVQDSLATLSAIILTAFVVACLYIGRGLLVPLALATLLTFLLAPLAARLERWLGRVGSVLCVVSLILAATVGVGWVVTQQMLDLMEKLPNYKENIQAKLDFVQKSGGKTITNLTRTINDLEMPGEAAVEAGKTPLSVIAEPVPVRVVDEDGKRLKLAKSILAPLAGPVGTIGLVILFLAFMLLQRNILRERLVRLISNDHVQETESALDDAGSRISRYLLMQLVVNVTYGLPLAIGLYFIGVPNAVLWGALAAVLRFLPYVGPWIAASFPVLLSLTVSSDWTAPLQTIGLILLLELISNNVLEPWLYGTSAGVLSFALIFAALVWTTLWGPVGLLLSTPLTVCLVVMGRHIPRLSFLEILLSDELPKRKFTERARWDRFSKKKQLPKAEIMNDIYQKQQEERKPQKQDRQPGREHQMDPKPVIIRDDYRGAARLEGRVAVITGGDSGIGRSVTVHFAREGADVAIIYLEEEQDAMRTRDLVEHEGRRCLMIAGDVGDPAFCADAMKRVAAELGRPGILINNAAEQHPKDELDGISDEQLYKTFRTNFFAYLYMAREARKYFEKGDCVINTTSVTACRGSGHLVDYASTKGAIVAFTRSLAQQWADDGIRVNAVAPGPIWTPLIPATFEADEVKSFGSNTLMKRAGQPCEVATCFVFLASSDASYMTGQTLHPNGGQFVGT